MLAVLRSVVVMVAGQDCPHPPSVLSYRATNTRPSSYQLQPTPLSPSPVTITHLKYNICIAILIYYCTSNQSNCSNIFSKKIYYYFMFYLILAMTLVTCLHISCDTISRSLILINIMSRQLSFTYFLLAEMLISIQKHPSSFN